MANSCVIDARLRKPLDELSVLVILSRMMNDLIRAARMRAGLKQHELARMAGLHPVTLCRYETGHREPDLAALRRLAAALGIPLSSLIPDLSSSSVPAMVTSANPAA